MATQAVRMKLVRYFFFLLSDVQLALCYPASPSNPVGESSDVWASVIANVAPLMALVGERNAKEYIRTTSSWAQLFLLATAPLWILSILVSAIRLTGSGFLRRLVGRECERRSESLVELTSLSVNPATSVYTPKAVEIDPIYSRDRVGFVCGHVGCKITPKDAVEGCRSLLAKHKKQTDVDRDHETVLALWNVSLDENGVLNMAKHLEGKSCSPQKLGSDASAALSFRMTGVSPTLNDSGNFRQHSFADWRDILVSLLFMVTTMGLQIIAWEYDFVSKQTLAMGLVGYLGVVLSTLILLAVVKSETTINV